MFLDICHRSSHRLDPARRIGKVKRWQVASSHLAATCSLVRDSLRGKLVLPQKMKQLSVMSQGKQYWGPKILQVNVRNGRNKTNGCINRSCQSIFLYNRMTFTVIVTEKIVTITVSASTLDRDNRSSQSRNVAERLAWYCTGEIRRTG